MLLLLLTHFLSPSILNRATKNRFCNIPLIIVLSRKRINRIRIKASPSVWSQLQNNDKMMFTYWPAIHHPNAGGGPFLLLAHHSSPLRCALSLGDLPDQFQQLDMAWMSSAAGPSHSFPLMSRGGADHGNRGMQKQSRSVGTQTERQLEEEEAEDMEDEALDAECAHIAQCLLEMADCWAAKYGLGLREKRPNERGGWLGWLLAKLFQ